uniref:Polyketide synthase n=1 Tax=Haptolina brevifila TaxID=156173 RepID=A0A7S2E5D4_9EUKA
MDVPSILGIAQLPSCVQYIESSGEALNQATIDNLPPGATLYNAGGPTETTIYYLSRVVDTSDHQRRLACVGRPLPNVTCFIVDPAATTPSLQPIGVWGEMWIGGVQVTRGYLNRPELTADKFITNPWLAMDPSGRGIVYRTGDRVRWYADGEIEFDGRIDFQVKLRGQRIELGEIEHTIQVQPGVQLAVVMKSGDSLVAYVSPACVVASPEESGFTAAVPFDCVVSLSGVTKVLPPFMVPSAVIGVHEWPRTSSSKIDRNRLPTMTIAAKKRTTVAPKVAEETLVRDAIATVLAIPAEDISVEDTFFQIGGNSLKAVALALALSKDATCKISPTTVINFPKIRDLAKAIELMRREVVLISSDVDTSSWQMPQSAVSVAGMDVLLPSGVTTMVACQDIMLSGCDAIEEVPTVRWDTGAVCPVPEQVGRHGGFVVNVDLFDSIAFGIAPGEVAAMDPQQRLLLESGYGALHTAASTRASLDGSLCGVLVAIYRADFANAVAGSPASGSVFAATGWALSIASGRLSYTLGLQGPCATCDTACSSGIAICHAARRALQLHECDVCLAGGINLILMNVVPLGYARAGFLSPTGRCHTFDARANGIALSEACGAIVLRHEGTRPALAVLVGGAVRQDGRSASLTAPSGRAQEKLLRAALADANLDEGLILVYEAHGTGTALGDPIEMGSVLQAVVARRASQRAPLRLNSIKANVAHTDAAAGLVGLLKMTQILRIWATEPNAQLRVLNPHGRGDFSRMAGCTPLCQGAALLGQLTGRCGVSSFGWSGTIAHAILLKEEEGRRILPLSREWRRRAFPWRMCHIATLACSNYVTCWVSFARCAPNTAAGSASSALVLAHEGQAIADVPRIFSTNRLVALILTSADSVAPATCGAMFTLAAAQQQLGHGPTNPPGSLLVITCSAEAAPADAASAAAHGGVWGLMRVLRLEHPRLQPTSIGVKRGANALGDARALLDSPRMNSVAEQEATWSSTERVPRLRKQSRTPQLCRVPLRTNGAFIITGGLGNLGSRAASLLGKLGAAHILLTSRGGRVRVLTHSSCGLIGDAAFSVVASDSSQRCDSSALCNALTPIGVLHAAGFADRELAERASAHKVYELQAPKACGASHWHGMVTAAPLEVMVLYSSVASGLANIGQATYATSNSWLDMLATSRRARGVLACALQWANVTDTGAFAASIRGMAAISLELYAECLRAELMASPSLSCTVQMMHSSDAHEFMDDLSDPSQPRFSELAAEACVCTCALTCATALGENEAATNGAIHLAQDPVWPSTMAQAMMQFVHELTGCSASSADTSLAEAFDSLTATEFVLRLRDLVGRTLSPSVIFDQPTVREIATHLQRNMAHLTASHSHAAGLSSLPQADGAQTLATLPPAQRHARLLVVVLSIIHNLTGSRVDEHTDLVDANFDSLMATELAMRLRDFSGCAISPMLVVEHPTPGGIATHLLAAHLLETKDLDPLAALSSGPSHEGLMVEHAQLAVAELWSMRCNCCLFQMKHLAVITSATPGPIALLGEERHKRDMLTTLLQLGLASEASEVHEDPNWLLTGGSSERHRLAQDAEGKRFAILVHPSARVHHTLVLKSGSVVGAGAAIGPDCQVGQHCTLGVLVAIAHDSIVGDFVTIGNGVIINGGCILEDGCTIEDYAVLRPKIRIGAGAIVRSASTVLRDVSASAIVAGIPAMEVSATATSDLRHSYVDAIRLFAAAGSMHTLRKEMADCLLLRVAKQIGSPSPSRGNGELRPPTANVGGVIDHSGRSVTAVGLVGAGGFGKMTLQFFSDIKWEGVYDDKSTLKSFQGVTIKGGVVDAPLELPLVLAVGSNQARQSIVSDQPHQSWATLIHPTAEVAADAIVGVGSIIEPYAVISPGAKVGAFAFVGMSVFLGPNVTIDDFTFVASSSYVASGCSISSLAVVGAGAFICPNTHVGAVSSVVMGSVVVEDVPKNFVAQGAPASLVIKRSAALLS